MDIISAYREVGTYRGAARGHNYDGVAGLVAERVGKTSGRISAQESRSYGQVQGRRGQRSST